MISIDDKLTVFRVPVAKEKNYIFNGWSKKKRIEKRKRKSKKKKIKRNQKKKKKNLTRKTRKENLSGMPGMHAKKNRHY